MQIHWFPKKMIYDGTQLRSLFAYMSEGLLGDSIVAWRGPCDISWEHMVDGEDLRAQSPIAGSDMVHFIIEKFDCSLLAGVGIQRLLTSIAGDLLREAAKEKSLAQQLVRSGDDLFVGEKKLSISVATLSPISCLIHFAMNVSTKGTPVPTLSLEDLGIEPESFARALMEKLSGEISSMVQATQKVRAIK